MRKFTFIIVLMIVATQLSFSNIETSKNLLFSKMKVAPPAIVFTESISEDASILVDIPCAEESVILEGQLHILFHSTINGNNFVFKSHFQPQGISGIGSVSGDKYQATGVTQDISKGTSKNGQFTATAVNNFRIIGQGLGNNYLIHETYHITFNANGIISIEKVSTSVECK